ncbi:MAG: IPT/TIG domain-containing protein [Candidatus Sericytochromatia bacterium]
MRLPSLAAWAGLSLLLSCQAGPSLSSSAPPSPAVTLLAVPAPEIPPVHYRPKPLPFALLEPQPAQPDGTRDLRVSFTYPQPGSGFRTQAFGCDEVAFAQIAVSGPRQTAPIYAVGSDATYQMLAASQCEIAATLSSVPYGNRVLSIRLYDSQRRLLTGSELTGALRLSAASQSIELSYRQTPAGRLMESLLSGEVADRFLAAQLDLDALQNLLDGLMGVSGSFPQYVFVHPPSLIDVAALVRDLRAANGDITALNGGPDYLHAAGSVRFSLAGHLIDQPVDVSLDDALSPNAVALANGQVLLSNVPPGTWQLRLSGAGYLPTRLSVTVQPGQQSNRGTVTIYPPQASLTAVSPGSGPSGSSVVLTGSAFNPTPANNVVRFGDTEAEVSAASLTSLTVTVPDGLTLGTYPLSVGIGANPAATGPSFNVTAPELSALSLSSGSSGDSLTLSGVGFSELPSDNTVYFGETAVAVTSASTTQLVVDVPSVPAAALALRVRVRGQASNALDFDLLPRLTSLSTGLTDGALPALIRGQTLTLNGSNFDPVPANNTVRFGSTELPAVSATATQLSVVIPTSLTSPADLALTVRTGGQLSNALNARLTGVSLDFSGGFQ